MRISATSPFGERAQLLRRRGPAGRRGNPRDHTVPAHGRVHPALAGSPLSLKRHLPRWGRIARTSPFGERAQLLRRRGPAGRRGNPRDHTEVVTRCTDASTRLSPVPPLSLKRHLPRWGRMRISREPLPLGEVPGRAEREPTRPHRSCHQMHGRVHPALAGSPSVTDVTSPPVGRMRVATFGESPLSRGS